MSADLRIENILIQVKSKLLENGIKLWLPPYYVEGGACDAELEVRITFRNTCGFNCGIGIIYKI